jgi:hypothetical protein
LSFSTRVELFNDPYAALAGAQFRLETLTLLLSAASEPARSSAPSGNMHAFRTVGLESWGKAKWKGSAVRNSNPLFPICLVPNSQSLLTGV